MSGAGVRLVEVEGEEMKKALMELKEVFVSSYGPWGSLALLQAMPDGVLTLTRCSQKILTLLKTPNPIIKTITSHLQGHTQCYHDSTLYAGILTCNLLIQGLQISMPRQRVAMAIDETVSMVLDWLKGNCPVKWELNLSSAEELLSLLCSYLGSKMSAFSLQELRHLSTLLLRGLLRALPSDGTTTINLSQHIHLHRLPFLPTHLCILHEGLLVSEQVCAVHGDWEHTNLRTDSNGYIITAVCDETLTATLPEGVEILFEGRVAVESVEEHLTVDKLLKFGRGLVEKGVGLLACQKSVHSTLRDYLNKQGVVVLERLSSLLIGPVHQLAGGSLISSISSHALGHSKFGAIADISKFDFQGHRFIRLKGISDSHSTLLLCSESERNLDELQSLCRDAMLLLEVCVGDTMVISGGGCADTVIANYLQSKCEGHSRSELERGDIIKMCVLDRVKQCFEEQVMALNKYGALVATDSFKHHCWFFPPSYHQEAREKLSHKTCNCGQLIFSDLPAETSWTELSCAGGGLLNVEVKSYKDAVPVPPSRSPKPKVLDLMSPRIAAIHCAAELTTTLLPIAYILTDTPH